MSVVATSLRAASNARRSSETRRRYQRLAAAISIRVMLLIMVVIPLFPIYWMVISALKGPQELLHLPPTFFPEQVHIAAFKTAFSVTPFADGVLSSVIIAGTATISVIVTSVLAGYVFAKHHFQGRETLFRLSIATMFVPPIVTLVPLYWLVTSMGLSNSYLGVILPWLANAFGIFLMRQFISDVPDELLEAARLDGSSELRVLGQVVAPLLKPAILTLAVFSFVFYWNNFLWPLSILQSASKFPVVLQLNNLISYSSGAQYENVVMAGALVSERPDPIDLFPHPARVRAGNLSRAGVTG